MAGQDIKGAEDQTDSATPEEPTAHEFVGTEAEDQTAVANPEDAASAAPDEAEPTGEPREAQPVEFQTLDSETSPQAGENLDLLLDVTVALSVELGGAEMPLSEILSLGTNSIVKLDRAVGEPVDILINRELVGRGEVVVVEDHLGVRVTELLKSPASSKSGD